jgi:hypothetical protein
LLGKSSTDFLKKTLGCKNVWGLFNPDLKKGDTIDVIAKELDVIPVMNFTALRNIDFVVASGARENYELTAEVIESIRRPGKPLIVVDSCEPPNVMEATKRDAGDNLIYYKVGNGYNRRLKYVLGSWAAGILGMRECLTWGCFSETFVLCYAFLCDPALKNLEWFSVTPEKIQIMSKWAKELGFSLPPEV